MTTSKVLENLLSKGIISDQQGNVIEAYLANKPFSIHWELRSILYLGILLFGSGLGVIVYENIDTIGHQVIIALIAMVTGAGFFYSYKFRLPFSWQQVKNSNKFTDYTLLVACTTFLSWKDTCNFNTSFLARNTGWPY